MNDARRKTLDELTALTERLGLYEEPTRVGDEASVALSHALQELRWVEAERDEAQETCRAWQGVYKTLEAHLMDRVAMQDAASPETWLNILRSSVGRVERDSEQLLNARWARERDGDEARAERDRLRKALEEIRFLPADFAYERIQRIIREALAGTEDDNE